jgi:hypothetical protein
MVLKWLGGGKLDHPLADEKGSKELFAALAAEEAAKAIEDICHWVESVMATEGFKPERRVEVILQLDEAAQVHQQKLAKDYLASPPPSKFQEARLWGALSVLWNDLAAAYAGCIDQIAEDSGAAGRLKPQLPLVVTRGVRAHAAQLKWLYMRYQPGSAALWQAFGKVYRFAEARKIQRENVSPYVRFPLPTSAEREFIKALMLAASSPDCLMPVEIELAERIIAHLAGAFLISDAHQPQATYNWIDLAGSTPPKRLTQAPPAGPGLRFFAAGAANEKLEGMIRVTQGGAVPTDLNLGRAYEATMVLRVLRHLKTNWAATPPVRKHDRYEVAHRLSVVNGFAGVHARVQDGPAGGKAETWLTQNISSGGIGAALDKTQGEWLTIGRLVGLSVEGGSGACSVGMVRRCNRGEQREMFVGLRTFAKTAFAVKLGGIDPPEAMLLSDGAALADDALICHREGGYDARVSPTMAFEGRNYLLVPIEMVEGGDDFELARYKAMLQS